MQMFVNQHLVAEAYLPVGFLFAESLNGLLALNKVGRYLFWFVQKYEENPKFRQENL